MKTGHRFSTFPNSIYSYHDLNEGRVPSTMSRYMEKVWQKEKDLIALKGSEMGYMLEFISRNPLNHVYMRVFLVKMYLLEH